MEMCKRSRIDAAMEELPISILKECYLIGYVTMVFSSQYSNRAESRDQNTTVLATICIVLSCPDCIQNSGMAVK